MFFYLVNLIYWLLLGLGIFCLGLMIIFGDGDEDLDVEMFLEVSFDVDIIYLDVEFDQGGDMEEGEVVFMVL